MRSTLAATVALALCVTAPGAGVAQTPSTEQVRTLLLGYEHVPEAPAFRALGPGTFEVLAALYEDETEAGFVRLRAVRAAAAFPTERTRRFLLGVARRGDEDALFPRQAVLSLERAFGARCVSDVAPFLRHHAPLVRRAAARALGRTRTNRARKHLREQLSREHDRQVRRKILKALQKR
ncbi:MAG: HEAT repeat domain-containing protein [Myxococcota bacterium]